MSVLALPSSGTYLSSIRESSQKACQDSNITINRTNIERLISSDAFQSLDRVKTLPGIALPLNFASALDELNVVSTLALLNFGTSFDGPLRENTGHGASNAIRALIFAMYITSTPSEGDHLSAQGFSSLSVAKVAELIGVDLHVEKPHPSLPGVTVGELGGPLYEYVQLVAHTLNETGEVLLGSGYPNLGFLVAEALKEGEKAAPDQTSGAMAEVVIEKLVRALPAFRDMSLVGSKPVYIFNKATYLLNVVSARFGSMTPTPFPIPRTGDLPVSADGLIPSILVHLGIIDLSSSGSLKNLWPSIPDEGIQSRLDQQKGGVAAQAVHVPHQPTLSPERAFLLRAAAITAAETISTVAKDASRPVTPSKLNLWLQNILKERADYKAIGGIVVKDTVFF